MGEQAQARPTMADRLTDTAARPLPDSGRPSRNGAEPPVLKEAWAWLTETPDDREFVEIIIEYLPTDARCREFLYQASIMQRCARVKRQQRPIYKGLLWPILHQLRHFDVYEWDGEIDLLLYAADRLVTVPLSTIEPQDVAWLWEPYIPLQKLTLLEGDPESGKTYLMLAIAAAVTRGFALPDAQGHMTAPHGVCGNVLYLTAEDGLADTLRKRADQCQADTSRIFVVPTADMFPDHMEPFSLARPHLLSAAIEEREARLVVLDPLTAFLGAAVDMHRANEVRPLMTRLVALATRHNCAIVAIRHWTKQPGGKARYRGQGNVDFYAAARSVLSVGESPEDERLRIMAQSKNSICAHGISIVFHITDAGLQWAGTSLMSADELSAAQPQRHKKQRQDAMEWLRAYLTHGPQHVKLIVAQAEAVGIRERTLWRAKEHLGILSSKDGEKWYWRLPHFQTWDRYPGMEEGESDVPF